MSARRMLMYVAGGLLIGAGSLYLGYATLAGWAALTSIAIGGWLWGAASYMKL